MANVWVGMSPPLIRDRRDGSFSRDVRARYKYIGGLFCGCCMGRFCAHLTEIPYVRIGLAWLFVALISPTSPTIVKGNAKTGKAPEQLRR